VFVSVTTILLVCEIGWVPLVVLISTVWHTHCIPYSTFHMLTYLKCWLSRDLSLMFNYVKITCDAMWSGGRFVPVFWRNPPHPLLG
jgi:hypothetical protein